MAKKNVLANSDMPKKELRKLYKEIKDDMKVKSKDLDVIFEIAMSDRENLFPNQNKDTEEECLRNWIKRYTQSVKNLPSSHKGETKKTCSDPALAKIVKIACGLDDDEIEEMERAHNLFMSAENIQGELLEEYIARNVEDSGWIWCAGNTLRAVDFCKKDGSALLQVKNKNNTENSSSSAIRNGTEIKKWYRLKTKRKKTNPEPSYEWDKLNDIINGDLDYDEEPCEMSEKDYQHFLKKVAKRNPGIILEGELWIKDTDK